MSERTVTQRKWSERPEQSDQTVAVLEALGFRIQLPECGDRKFDSHGTLMSETFTKSVNGFAEKVTVNYRYVRTYTCERCKRVGLVSDKYTHADYHVAEDARKAATKRLRYYDDFYDDYSWWQ